MNECSVCKKLIQEPATECSAKCLAMASQNDRGRINKAQSAFHESMRKMLQPVDGRIKEPVEVPKLKIKHRWMKNRNLVQGSVIISFNGEGIAVIPDMGHNRSAVEEVVKNSKGLIEILDAVKPVEVVPIITEKPVEVKPVVIGKPKVKSIPPVEVKIVDDDKLEFIEEKKDIVKEIEIKEPKIQKPEVVDKPIDDEPANKMVGKKKLFGKKSTTFKK